MKTKWGKLMLTVLLGAVLSQDALAFYNSSTGRWLSRDPIEEHGGENLYCLVWNDSVNLWDYLGLGCKVDFSCTLNPGWTSPGWTSLTVNCPYTCKETGRTTVPIGPGVDCDKVPKNLTINFESTVFCRSCPKTTAHAWIFSDADLKTDCSRSTCRAGCDLTFNSLIKSKNPVVRAAAIAAKTACYDSCNSFCRNP